MPAGPGRGLPGRAGVRRGRPGDAVCTSCSRAPWCCRGGWAPTMSRWAGHRSPACTPAPGRPTWATGSRSVYNSSMRVTEPSRFFVLDADMFAELMHEWFPMAVHLLEGMFFGRQSLLELTARARAAARARHAVGRPDPRAEQPGRGRGPGGRRAARAGRRHAAQAGHDRGRGMGPAATRGDADQAAGGGRRAGAEGAAAVAAGGVGPGGGHHRLAGFPRAGRRLAARADLRRRRAGCRLAGAASRPTVDAADAGRRRCAGCTTPSRPSY